MESGADINRPKEDQPREVNFSQRVQERFQLAFAEVYRKRGQESDGFNVSVEVDFRAHETETDFEGLEQRFKDYDPAIFIPEGKEWRQKDLNLLRQSASGNINNTQLRRRLKDRSVGFRTSAEIVSGSNKAITFIDVPHGHGLEEESDKAWNFNPPLDGNFSRVLGYTTDNFLTNLALYINKREKYMLEQINSEKVEELMETYPMLGDLKSIRVFMFLGDNHAPMPSDFSNDSFTSEGIIRKRYDKKIDDELVAKVFLERTLDPLFKYFPMWLRKDSIKFSRFKRKTLSKFNIEDTEKIFECIKNNQHSFQNLSFDPPEELLKLFYGTLEKNNLKILQNEKELDEFLAEPESPQAKIVK